jgi:hypothetical protein
MYRRAENGSTNVPKASSVLDPEISSPESDRKPRDLGVSGASVESTPPRRRRRFSASEKLRLLKAAEAAIASGERGALAEPLFYPTASTHSTGICPPARTLTRGGPPPRISASRE